MFAWICHIQTKLISRYFHFLVSICLTEWNLANMQNHYVFMLLFSHQTGSAVAVLWVIFSICGAIGANCHELDVVRKDSQGIKEDNSQDAVKDTSITDILTANVIGRLKPLSSSASAFSPLYFPFSHV